MTEAKPSRLGPRALAILDYIERVYPCGAIPHGALTDIGQVFGITHERVRQIVNRAGVERVPRSRTSVPKGCRHCSFPAVKGTPYCAEHRFVPLICAECGKEFHIRPSELHARMNARKGGRREPQFYCSRKCYGAYAGRNYGFAAHPENATRGGRKPQTHCKRGHEFTPENTYLSRRQRKCRACATESIRKWRARQRASNQQATPAPSTPSTTNSAPAPVGDSPAGSTAATSEEHRQ